MWPVVLEGEGDFGLRILNLSMVLDGLVFPSDGGFQYSGRRQVQDEWRQYPHRVFQLIFLALVRQAGFPVLLALLFVKETAQTLSSFFHVASLERPEAIGMRQKCSADALESVFMNLLPKLFDVGIDFVFHIGELLLRPG